MKKCSLIFIMMLVMLQIVQAQSPKKFNYQSVVRDAAGNAIANRHVSLRMTILTDTVSNAVAYAEMFSVTTNQFGLVNIAIGGGTPMTGSFAAIDWTNGNKFIRTEIDVAGGNQFASMGTAQLFSVPFALYATNSGDVSNTWRFSNNDVVSLNTGNIGIGTTTPTSKLHVNFGDMLVTGWDPVNLPSTVSLAPGNGTGSRHFFYKDMSAFRTGGIDDGSFIRSKNYTPLEDASHYWDKEFIGQFSFAGGYNVKANGIASVALGAMNRSIGDFSFTAGSSNMAQSFCSSALGYENSIINAGEATAIGFNNIVSRTLGTAIGRDNVIDGAQAVAIGSGNEAGGINAVAIGTGNKASGDFSVTIGQNMSTAGHTGTMMLGDNSFPSDNGVTGAGTDNQLIARFAGGYYFLSMSDNGTRTGVFINPGQNGWSSISDSTKKTAFLHLEGESVLNKLNTFDRLGSWTYKGQDPKLFRHYGPMAQDFYNAFGHDGIGVSGNDTLINSVDMNGVLFIAVQALVQRTNIMRTQMASAEHHARDQEAALQTVLTENAELRKQMAHIKDLESRLDKLAMLVPAGEGGK